MIPLRDAFTGAHVRIATVVLVAFVAMNYAVTGDLRVAFATPLGSMTGAIARDVQSCCTTFSLFLLPFVAAVLGLGILAQIVERSSADRRVLRLSAWALACFGWCFSGLVSFMHALE